MPTLRTIILAGGAGKRLQTTLHGRAKQFARHGDRARNGSVQTLLGQTVTRLQPVSDQQLIITQVKHMAKAQAAANSAGLGVMLMGEPAARNTAAAIACGLQFYKNEFAPAAKDEWILVAPSDHKIAPEAALLDSISEAMRSPALANEIVLWGVSAKAANPNFGMIKTSSNAHTSQTALTVESFVEKPQSETLPACADGEKLWFNCGIFLARTEIWRQAFAKFQPAMWLTAEYAVAKAQLGQYGLQLDSPAMLRMAKLPVDKAIIEKADNLRLIPADFGWADLGTPESWREAV